MITCSVGVPSEVSEQTLRAFLRLYQLETWMREMVYLELKAYYGIDWWVEVQGLRDANVHLAEKYRSSDRKHPHISTPENDPLWFVSFDTLLKIIFHSKMWKRFEPYFTTKKILRSKFDEIAPVRNRVAHCRALHEYDLRRLEQLMLDFDQGFWRFCTSNQDYYVLPESNSVAGTYKKHANINVLYTVRPSLKSRHVKPDLGRGLVYDATVVSRYPNARYLEYEKILSYTQRFHRYVLHIVLDSFQNSLRVTIPGTVTEETVIEIIDKFDYACRNYYSVVPLVLNRAHAGAEEKPDLIREHKERQRPFEAIAAKWPHYVVPPSHPYAFLDRGCPCAFFGIE